MPDETKIFTRNHTLTDGELMRQLAERFRQDPTSSTTLALRERVGSILETSGGENVASEESVPYSPFPPDIDVTTLPGFMQNSYITWQQLSPDIQKKVSYYQKNWEWFVNIDGTKISLQNESAQSNPDAGIYVDKDNTYFSHSAALARVKGKKGSLPDPDLWLKMADFLGGFKQLRDILQIPLAGFFHPRDGLNEKNQSEKYCLVWSSQESQGLYIIGSDGRIATGIYDSSGLSVRLLDESVSDHQGDINYAQLATEHAEFIGSHNSLQIAQWLGEKLGIENWAKGEFYGENQILSTPVGTGMDRLQSFVEAIGISWSKANGSSNIHGLYLLLDGYVQNALFGRENMKQVDEGLRTFDRDWAAMGEEEPIKHRYFLEKTGLFPPGDWDEFPGVRNENGVFGSSDEFCVSGSLKDHDIYSLRLSRDKSEVGLSIASTARLCFLA